MRLLFTLITGLFFLLGFLLNKTLKNNTNIGALSIGLAFIVMFNLIVFDVGPEVLEGINIYTIICIILGILILKFMDLFVPDHHHDHKEKHDNLKEHNNHLEHISVITILALTLHNVIECLALYNVSSSLRAGALMCAGIGLHNLPLGFQIGGSLKKHKTIYVLILTLSGFLGGIVGFLWNVPEVAQMLVLSFTLGMLIYLTVFELLKELWEERKNIFSYYGIMIGIVLIILARLI